MTTSRSNSPTSCSRKTEKQPVIAATSLSSDLRFGQGRYFRALCSPGRRGFVAAFLLGIGLQSSISYHADARNSDRLDWSWLAQNTAACDALSLFEKGRELVAAGNVEAAVAETQKSLECATERFGSQHRNIAVILDDLAVQHYRLRQLDQALAYGKRAVAIIKATSPGSTDHATFATNLASFHTAFGGGGIELDLVSAKLDIKRSKLGRAERRLEDIISLRPEEQMVLADSYYHLGFIEILRGQFLEAEASFKNALNAYREKLGERHPAVGRTVQSLALIQQGLGRFQETERLYQRAIGIFRDTLDPGSISIAATKVEFSLMLVETGQTGRAIKEIQEALLIFEQDPGNWALRRGYARSALGFAHQREGDVTNAALSFEEALRLIEQVRGGEASDLPPGLTALAFIRMEQGRLDDAETLLRRAIDIRKKDEALTPWGLAKSFSAMGTLRAKQGRLDEALNELGDAVGVVRGRLNGSVGASFSAAQGELLKDRSIFEQFLAVAYRRYQQEPGDLLPQLFEVAQLPNLTDTAEAVSQMSARFAEQGGELGGLLRTRQDKIEARRAQDRQLTELLSSRTDDVQLHDLKSRLERLNAEIALLDEQLEQAFPDFVELIHSKPLPLRDVQGFLEPGEALFFT